MSPLEYWILVAYGAIVAAWPVRHLVVAWMFARLDKLTTASPLFSGQPEPLISVIIPAKDEEATLHDCLASVSAQSYPNLEILVVDDRSTDRTAEIAQRMADSDPRIKVLRIVDLPEGWTGKNNAMQTATRSARGEWLWMLDADTRHHPDALSICLAYAHQQQAAMVSLMPEQRCLTFWEKVVQPLEGIVLMRSFPPLKVNNDQSRLGFANGQFILMRREAFDQVGGYNPVRDRLLEDIALGQQFKNAGLPIRVAIGTEISSTRMYEGLSPLIRGWARILYDGLGRRSWPIVGKIIEPLVFSQTGDLALAAALVLLAFGYWQPFTYWLLGLSLLHQFLKTWLLWKMYRLSSPRTARYAVFYSLAGLVSAWISIRAIEMCRTGKVTWRGTRYQAGRTPAPAPAGNATLG